MNIQCQILHQCLDSNFRVIRRIETNLTGADLHLMRLMSKVRLNPNPWVFFPGLLANRQGQDGELQSPRSSNAHVQRRHAYGLGEFGPGGTMLPRYEVSMTESREKCWDLEYIRLIYLYI